MLDTSFSISYNIQARVNCLERVTRNSSYYDVKEARRYIATAVSYTHGTHCILMLIKYK
jgi:hypothetical protein